MFLWIKGMTKTGRYDAFISYRHCAPDSEIASRLQKKLEGFRLPKEIAEKIQRLENIRIKGRFHYEDILSLSTEARQKLSRIDPETMAQASRIPGVSPSDINVLLVLMNR